MRMLGCVLFAWGLVGCREWPVCGNEEELTSADAEFGSVANGDYLVCDPGMGAGDACPDYHDVDAQALFEAAVGPSEHGYEWYDLRVDCGPETTRTDACCYVIDVRLAIMTTPAR
jgi:hypothetical protein